MPRFDTDRLIVSFLTRTRSRDPTSQLLTMAQTSQPPKTKDILPSIKALIADDPALMEEAITLVSRGVGPERRSTPGGLVARRLPAAASRNALRVLRYLLDLGLLDVNNLHSNDLMARDTC